MSTNLEIEFKSILSEEDYQKLFSRYGKHRMYTQENYYFDTDRREIRSKGCGLRARVKNEEYELTLKENAEVGKIEYNQQISNISFIKLAKGEDFPDGEVKDIIVSKLGLKIEEVKPLGVLVTDRIDLKFCGSLISIDKSTYNGITDYEIECEDVSMEKAKKHLNKFLKDNDIEYKKSQGGKLKRFLATLK